MNLALHLFKKDVRRTRVLALIWLFLLALQCALIGESAQLGDPVLQGLFLTLSIAVPLFRLVVLVVLVPHLVQEEPLVGTTAFWFTRPIARSSVLRAKALEAAVLVTLPLLVEVAVLAANGFSGHDLALAVPEILLGDLGAVITIAAIAALTPNIGRFAIAGAVLLLAVVSANLVIYWARLLLDPTSVLQFAAASASLAKARGVANSLVVVLGGGAVLAHQYLTRKTARSVVLAAVVAVGSVAVGGFWPWNFLAPEKVELPALDASAVSLRMRGRVSQDLPLARAGASRTKEIGAHLEVTGLPAGVFCTVERAHPSLTLPDGQPLKVSEPMGMFGYMAGRPNVGAVEDALGGTPVVNVTVALGEPRGLLAVDADTYNQQADAALKLSVDLDFIASKYAVVAELPLAKGSRYDNGSEHDVITDILKQGDGIEIVLDQRKAQLVFDRSNPGTNPALSLAGQGDTVYVLRNPVRNQVVLTKSDARFGFLDAFQMGGRRLVHRKLHLAFGREQYVLAPALTDAWLADAKLVRLERIPVARFSKTLVVDDFKLGSTNRSTAFEPPPMPAMNTDVLATLRLPEGATKTQVRDYVESVLLTTQRQGSFRQDAPQIEMLRRVGSANMDVLIEMEDRVADGSARYCLNTVTHELARREDKAWVLKSLPTRFELIDVVVKYGWQAEARDTLVSLLRNPGERVLPRAWIQAVASLEDPAVYPDLLAYLVRGPNRQQAFNTIRKLPGIDLREAVAAGWAKARSGARREILDSCAMAAEFGHLDALDALATVLRESNDQPDLRHAATLFKRYTQATGDDAELVGWYDANHARLTFDEHRKKFLVKPGD